jgi:hypothetical protein
LLRALIDGILDGICIIGIAIACSTGATSADEVALAQILVLWLRLRVVLSAIQETFWSGKSIERALEFLRSVGRVFIALTPGLDSHSASLKNRVTVPSNSDWNIVELDVFEDELSGSNWDGVGLPSLTIC